MTKMNAYDSLWTTAAESDMLFLLSNVNIELLELNGDYYLLFCYLTRKYREITVFIKLSNEQHNAKENTQINSRCWKKPMKRMKIRWNIHDFYEQKNYYNILYSRCSLLINSGHFDKCNFEHRFFYTNINCHIQYFDCIFRTKYFFSNRIWIRVECFLDVVLDLVPFLILYF